MELKKLYRISQYARYKNVSYEAVRKWIIANKIKTEVIGGTIFVVGEEENKIDNHEI